MKQLMVTGGSRGIGADTARLGAARGYAVCINYRQNEAVARALVREITDGGGEAVAVAGDVGSEADVVRLFAEVERTLGPITALVNNAGILGRRSARSPNEYVDYAAAKGALDSFTIGLAKEVAAKGIRVNAVRPSVIYTEIHASGGEPERVERVKAAVPMQRGGQAEEVARAILWLLSEEASHSNAALLAVSGGR